MENIRITVQGKGISEVSQNTPISEFLRQVFPGKVVSFLAAKVNGQLRDLSYRLDQDSSLEPVDFSSIEGRDVLRHSTSHLLAQAVKELFPGTKLAIGPAIEEGFYYDFDRPDPFTPDDLGRIEERMREISKRNIVITREELSKEEAKSLFVKLGETYKVELISELADSSVSCYRQGDFVDLCRGPHVPSTARLKIFKLLSVAGAYWRGDERNPMLQRIYGTAYETEEDLKAHLERLEEIARRDHRKLGKELDLFSLHDEVGSGLVHWHPKGARIRILVEDYWRKRHFESEYDILFTPHIGREWVWQTSGHLTFYQENMYSPMEVEGNRYYLKPVNCPFQIMVYKTKLHSYRDLPLRWAELGTVYRYERSGTLQGLLRVRGITQDDAHIICTPEQVEDEILRVLDFSIGMLADFGFTNLKIELSVRDPKSLHKYTGADAMWIRAEASLVKALQTRGIAYERIEGEAVFYGPKIDIKIKDALGRTWQCSTIQFDFNMPERFDMVYIGEDGRERRPYMVHRTLLGAMERFFALLIEHYAGAFPLWLAPVQAVVMPITDAQTDYARTILRELQERGFRAEADLRPEKVGAKIRDAETQKIPYMLVVGKREVEDGTLSVRRHGKGDLGAFPKQEFYERISQEVDRKTAE